MAERENARSIGEVFYETRVLQGRRWSLRRFATEALDGRIEPVMLSYIEKGERFPSEDLVRHLAAFRREDPQTLLAMLWRDRVLYAVTREIDRAFQAPPAVGDVADGALAVRISRAVAVSIMSKPHIEALRVLGASPWRIYFGHLLPGTIGSVMVYATADAGTAALAVATLSFLGLGIQPPTPEWGQMLVDALPYLESDPRQVLLPGLALTAAVIGFNTLGESIALNRIPKPLTRRMLAIRRAEVASWSKENSDA